MPDPVSWPLVAAAAGVGFAGLGVGFVAGRRTGSAARARALEQELAAVREELAQYRQRVSTHFARTSELVRELTVQYRAVYDHLAEGARGLCPDGVPALARSLEAALTAGSSQRPDEKSEAAGPSEQHQDVFRRPPIHHRPANGQEDLPPLEMDSEDNRFPLGDER